MAMVKEKEITITVYGELYKRFLKMFCFSKYFDLMSNDNMELAKRCIGEKAYAYELKLISDDGLSEKDAYQKVLTDIVYGVRTDDV